MTAPSCRDRGGDFSVWVEHVIADTPELLRVFHSSFFGERVRAEDRPRNEAILAGYRTLASDLRGGVPAAYCVNDIKQWAGEDPEMKPFGFVWGVEKTSIFGCTDTGTATSTGGDTDGNAESSVDRNRWVGAERAPCDGFHLRCDGAAAIEDRLRCAMWNVFSARYVDKVETLRAQAINTHPASGAAPVVEKTSTWRTALYIAGPIAVVLAAALLGRGVIVDRRRETPRHQGAYTGEGGIDDDAERGSERRKSVRLAQPRVSRRWVWRTAVMTLVFGVLALVNTPAAGAAPKDVSEIPAHLQKYIPGSPGWDSSPWMTSAACRERGGDFSAWVSTVIADTPELLKVFNAQLFGPDAPESGKARSDAILAGYQQLATDLQGQVPIGYCVDDMKRWVGEDRKMRPFGFAWGLEETTIFGCTDTDPGVKESEYRNKWVGAERGPCDGFHVSCKHAGADKERCEAWNEFSKDYTDRVYNLRATAINDHPATQQGDVDVRIKSPQEIAGDIAVWWCGRLARASAKGAATFLGEAMTFWTRTDRSSMLETPAIKTIQDLLWYVGVVLLVGSVMWQGIMLLYKRKPGPVVNTSMGLLSFIGWSTLGGTVAVLMYEAGLALTAQVLDGAINRFTTSMGNAMMANVVVSAPIIFFLGVILFFLACIQWFLGFFRMGALVILLALIPLAAAGQINEATKPWLPKIASWALVIIWYQPVSGVVFAVGFVLIGDGTDISTVMTGMATLGLGVLVMPAMHRFFDWGGRAFASGGSGGGGAMVAGAAASALGGAFSHYMDRTGPGGRGGPGGGTGGGDSGGGGGDSEPSYGAPPLTSAHAGDGPGEGSGTSRNGTPGGGVPPMPAGGVTPAFAGSQTGSTGTPSGTPADTPSGAPTGGPTSAAGPGGAAVVAAQAARDGVAGAMTDGAPPVGGEHRG